MKDGLYHVDGLLTRTGDAPLFLKYSFSRRPTSKFLHRTTSKSTTAIRCTYKKFPQFPEVPQSTSIIYFLLLLHITEAQQLSFLLQYFVSIQPQALYAKSISIPLPTLRWHQPSPIPSPSQLQSHPT